MKDPLSVMSLHKPEQSAYHDVQSRRVRKTYPCCGQPGEVDGPLGVLCKCGAAVHMRDMVDIMVQDWTKTCCIVCDRRSVVGWK